MTTQGKKRGNPWRNAAGRLADKTTDADQSPYTHNVDRKQQPLSRRQEKIQSRLRAEADHLRASIQRAKATAGDAADVGNQAARLAAIQRQLEGKATIPAKVSKPAKGTVPASDTLANFMAPKNPKAEALRGKIAKLSEQFEGMYDKYLAEGGSEKKAYRARRDFRRFRREAEAVGIYQSKTRPHVILEKLHKQMAEIAAPMAAEYQALRLHKQGKRPHPASYPKQPHRIADRENQKQLSALVAMRQRIDSARGAVRRGVNDEDNVEYDIGVPKKTLAARYRAEARFRRDIETRKRKLAERKQRETNAYIRAANTKKAKARRAALAAQRLADKNIYENELPG